MAIKIENLYKSYQDKQVLENLNMEFAEGKITCIMAPSGKGKRDRRERYQCCLSRR